MRTKLAVGALGIAVGFGATPVFAQATGQPNTNMPGMSTTSPAQPGQQQSSGMCGCCQRMAMNQQQNQQQAPRPQ